GDVFALLPRPEGLVVGGVFNHANGAVAQTVARWTGSAWETIGPGASMEGGVRALAMHNGELYAAGTMARAGNPDLVMRLARFECPERTGAPQHTAAEGCAAGV